MFGPEGLWRDNSTEHSYPEVLVIHVGLHSCIHALVPRRNDTMLAQHEAGIPIMMKAIHEAVHRIPATLPKTTVIIQLPGRAGNTDANLDACSRRFNRILAKSAHEYGFPVFEREEIERRLLFKSEYWPDHRTIKPLLHLENPAPNVVGTSLLSLISCLARDGKKVNSHFLPPDL